MSTARPPEGSQQGEGTAVNGEPSAWQAEFDVVVAGSGAGGMAAALTAAQAGLSVLIVEKTSRVGGSTAISGGAIWAPLNAHSAAVGHPDTREQVQTYLRATVGAHAPAALQQAFVDHAAEAVAWFESNTALKLAGRAYSPDYYPDRPGAALGGRSLDPVAFDGRLLGPAFKDLRDPLPEFMVLGHMMVTMTDARHLLAALQSFTSWKESMKLVLRYGFDRLSGYHRGTRLVLGNALAARLFKSVLDRQIPYWLDAPLQNLHQDGGRTVGVTVLRGGRPVRVRARRGVVVATGGFPWDAAMRRQHFPAPTGPWSMSPEGNAGEGIALARQAGAALGSAHASPAFWAPVSILKRPDGSELRYPHLVWDRAKPGLIAVNRRGERFVNESTSYHEFVRAMQARPENLPAYLVCDRRFIDLWGLGLALPGGRPREHLVRAGYLRRATSLTELATQLGIDAGRLTAAAASMNHAASQGVDEAFGKGSTAYNRYLGDAAQAPNPCLGPIDEPPYFAVEVLAGDIGTALGIATNAHAQALDAAGQPMPGLYVAGNDMHSVMGGQYPAPGITLGPALTFGWLAGRHLASQETTP